jgi:hypothetical protein
VGLWVLGIVEAGLNLAETDRFVSQFESGVALPLDVDGVTAKP